MNLSLMTLEDFQAVRIPPQAAGTNLPARKFTLSSSGVTASLTTTGGIPNQDASSAREERLSPPPRIAIIPDAGQDRLERFIDALNDALQLSHTSAASDEGDPIDHQTLTYAVQSLAPLMVSLELSPPLILPLQNGGIGAEWHTSGMNIELRFRKPYDVYAVLEDARGIISPFHSRDPELVNASSALSELGKRSIE
jgi:hypothetical protein